MAQTSPVVYIVATPIGNLDDMTARAKQTLAAVDMVAAEDTRQARKLLSHLGIQGKQLVSYQDHGETERADALVKRLQAEHLSLAVVSDAGTPCIADPGYRIVAAAKAAGIAVHPIPGPSALTTLVSASGLPSNRLLFVGFLPTRQGALRTEIEGWAATGASIVFFEATRRLERTLSTIREVYPEARVAVGRELTKLYEEIVTVPIGEAMTWLSAHATLKGEATVMVTPGVKLGAGGDTLTEDDLLKAASKAFAKGATLKELLIKYKDSGWKRQELYGLLLRAKDQG